MRNVPHIWDAWTSTEPNVGDYKPCTRVTVEKSFRLRLSGTESVVSRTVGKWTRGPARWYQRAETAEQVETEIPNVMSVSVERSIDSDAGTCKVTIRNSVNLGWGEPEETSGQFGRPGYFTWSRGMSQESIARWGHVRNEWRDVFVPNALLRTYQGFGGHDKDLEDAVEDGNLVLSGVWLVDEVDVSTNGDLNLSCRDMGKLLLDQQLFPPLVPAAEYPLRYERYTYEGFVIPPEPPPGTEHEIINQSVGSTDGLGDYVDGPTFTVRSSSDPTGVNAIVFGHRPGDATDMSYEPPDSGGNYAHQHSYWLSGGYDFATGADSYPWIECNSHGWEVNMVYLHTWAGNYMFYVSVWENGGWVAPEPGGQGGIVPSTEPSAAVPYVASYGSTWEGGYPAGSNQYALPRTYIASKVRISFTNLALSQEGGYRAGARKVMAQLDRTLTFYPSLVFAACPYPNGAGYWQTRSDGRHYAFGDARNHPISGTTPEQTHTAWVLGINAHPDGTGYWTLDMFGRVIAYGVANWEGDLSTSGRTDIVDFAPTPSGDGYYILCRDGTVHPYGDATNHGNSPVTGTMPSGAPVIARSIESHPSTPGYWILWTDGTVTAHALTDHGSANRVGFATSEYVASIRRNKTGTGYWIVSGGGIVQAFGAAIHHGNAARYEQAAWVNGLCWDFIPDWDADGGYAVQHADGKLDYLGGFVQFGSIGEGGGTLRKAGNYKDYADIIKELLLWSGFYLYRNPQPSSFPDVYGNIETTGAFATTPLPEDMFDKRPVMDAITQIKEIVGYVFFVDDEGGARFEAPNWWGLGNYDYDGVALDLMPEIDEQIQLTDYSIRFHDTDARSEIIIASENPYPTVPGQPGATGVVVTRITPPNATDLKGLCKPAMWTNGVFTNATEQKTMADLIAMHIWFARRTGEVSCTGNPLIGPNDQVRIYERDTGETFVHYVRGVQTSHDLETGKYTMSLSTHWLGGSPWNTSVYYFSCATRPQFDGYWEVGSSGDVYAFGAARLYDKNEDATHIETVLGLRSTPTGQGYLTVDVSGKVITHGDGEHYGDLFEQRLNVKDFALTPTGDGYYILLGDGTVEVFGNAVHRGNATVTGTMPSDMPVQAESIEVHPAGAGYWILQSDGTVSAHNVTAHGNANRIGFTTTEYVSCLRTTVDGDGYWIVSGSGYVQAFGAAADYGESRPRPNHNAIYDLIWDMMPVDGGYALLRADGSIDTYGSFVDRGAVKENKAPKIWAISDRVNVDVPGLPQIVASPEVLKFLKGVESKATVNVATEQFNDEGTATQKARN